MKLYRFVTESEVAAETCRKSLIASVESAITCRIFSSLNQLFCHLFIWLSHEKNQTKIQGS